MSLKFNRRELDFLLYEFLDTEALCAQPRYAAHDRETFDAIVDSALAVAGETFANHAAEIDAQEPEFVDGRVRMLPAVKQGLDAFVDNGFMGVGFAEADGGLQLPYTISQALNWVFTAANTGTSGYAFLTMAAANLLSAHGSEEQKARYMRPMIAGRYFGTMCLSEPHAGSSLGDIRTRAEPCADGSYALSGTKMWISGGEHELADNIVHLVLAKIPGSPPGTKGISLFLVPKYRLDAQGEPADFNHVVLAGLNHKMGYRGTVNTLLNFGEGGECRGWLVGEVNQGLACMFHMMNEARIGVGLNAAIHGYAGYLHSLDYARERPQGRPTGQRDPASPQVPIIEHADVKRMLLLQKVYSEGALALGLYGAALVDQQHTSDEADVRAEIGLELEILTPIIKAWSAHFALQANYWGQQILGGYGYTRDYPLERIYRDNRLNPIHEGTNGIQSLDLLGRKVVAQRGAAFQLLIRRMQASVEAASADAELAPHAQALAAAIEVVTGTTTKLGMAAAQGEVERFLANSWEYLEMLGHTVIAWVWLRQAQTAQRGLARSDCSAEARAHYAGKLAACRYFYRWELPKIRRQAELLSALDDSVLQMPAEGF